KSNNVGPVDDGSVGIGDVKAVFDDVGGDQHDVFMMDEINHVFLQLYPIHLPVSTVDSGIRHELHDQVGDAVDLADSVVNKKYLSATSQSVRHGIPDHFFCKGLNLCSDRLAVGRRRSNHREI